MTGKNNRYLIDNIPHYSKYESSGGYTLIELVAAIAVFTIGILGSLGLAVSNYNDSQDNLDRITAINLAREGIELVRNIRDSNWLKIDANDSANCGGNDCTWNYGLDTLLSSYAVVDYTYDVDNGVSFLPNCNDSIENCASGYITNNDLTELYLNPYSYYYHNTTTPAVNDKTKFSRVIKFNRICFDPGPGGYLETTLAGMLSACAPGETQIGLEVISHVQWDDYGETKYVQLADKIYNWRR